MQFTMESTTLLLIHYSQVPAPFKTMQFIIKYMMLLHIGPSQVSPPNQKNVVDHAIHDVIACRP